MIKDNPLSGDPMSTPQRSAVSTQRSELDASTLGDFLREISRKYGPDPALIMKPSFRSLASRRSAISST